VLGAWQAHYGRAAFVSMGVTDESASEAVAREQADRRGWAFERIEGNLRFDDVSFSYDEVRPTLKHISFEVRAGEMIGLVGPSGGGKSTLVNLIPRFYDVSSGSSAVDGVDIRRFAGGAYRRHVGMVLQDPYLFHGSVLDNIRYGAPEATPPRWSRPRASPTRTTSCASCRTATTPWSAGAGTRCRAASGSASASRAPCSRTRAS